MLSVSKSAWGRLVLKPIFRSGWDLPSRVSQEKNSKVGGFGELGKPPPPLFGLRALEPGSIRSQGIDGSIGGAFSEYQRKMWQVSRVLPWKTISTGCPPNKYPHRDII